MTAAFAAGPATERIELSTLDGFTLSKAELARIVVFVFLQHSGQTNSALPGQTGISSKGVKGIGPPDEHNPLSRSYFGVADDSSRDDVCIGSAPDGEETGSSALSLPSQPLSRRLAAGRRESGSLVSPGKLSKPHAKLEGIENCEKCHEPGRKVTAARCLECHKPVAERIRARKGVHRDATGDDCATCHVEHAGLDGDLRHFDDERVRPQRPDRLRAGRPARAARLQGLPQGPLVPGSLPLVRVLPQGCSQGHARRHVPDLPRDERRIQGHPQGLRPLDDEVPSDGRPPEDPVRELPQDAKATTGSRATRPARTAIRIPTSRRSERARRATSRRASGRSRRGGSSTTRRPDTRSRAGTRPSPARRAT